MHDLGIHPRKLVFIIQYALVNHTSYGTYHSFQNECDNATFGLVLHTRSIVNHKTVGYVLRQHANVMKYKKVSLNYGKCA